MSNKGCRSIKFLPIVAVKNKESPFNEENTKACFILVGDMINH